MIFISLVVLLLLASSGADDQYKSLEEIVTWNVLEYGFPSDVERQYAIGSGLYKENSGTPIDVAVQYRPDGSRRIFTTIPRFTEGIPFTLATVSDSQGPNGPLIYAYPSYEWHNKNNAGCKGITSAFRVVIDECDQMWVIDSGVVNDIQICQPQLFTFDLKTDTLINRYQFPGNVFTPGVSLFITPAVDIYDPPPKGRCLKAMVYVADVTQPGLVVYSSEHNMAWRVESELMRPNPAWGTHTVAGESFDLMDGIFAINLTPHTKKGQERSLIFHALASETECSVPLRYINNHTLWQTKPDDTESAFHVIGKRGVQAAMEAIDKRGNLFANTEDPLSIFVWNIYTAYTTESFRVVANNPKQLQFASGMKVVRNPRGHEELWVSTCRFQKIATGTLNPNETNFRIMACKIDDLLSNKGCSSLDEKKPGHFWPKPRNPRSINELNDYSQF